MNINSNATSAVVDSLFRLVWDGSGHRGAAGATGQQTALLLDRSRGALVCCVPIDRSVCVAPVHLEQVCCFWRCRGRASETKDETYSVT